MAGRYISYANLIARYPKSTDIGSESFIDSNYISYSEAWVDGALAPAYSSPFSSNNLTVKDLCIDYSYMKIIQFKDTDKATAMWENIDMRVQALINGEAQMVTEDGTALGQDVSQAWSETDGYAPTFGAGDITNMQVSSSRLYNEESARD